MPFDLVLVRHGESEGNVANHASKRGDDSYYAGEFLERHSSDWRLTERGREQARACGEYLRQAFPEGFDRHYTSEYLRAVETAATLQLPDAEWLVDFYLRERDWGVLDVMSVSEREERFAEALRGREIDSFYWAPPSGESLAQLCLRIDRVIDTLHRECEGKRVLIVSHGEVMWAFRTRLERLSSDDYARLDDDPAEKIHNCQVLHYSRRNPDDSDDVASYLAYRRSICPWQREEESEGWQEIVRHKLSNDDLLARAGAVKPLIA